MFLKESKRRLKKTASRKLEQKICNIFKSEFFLFLKIVSINQYKFVTIAYKFYNIGPFDNTFNADVQLIHKIMNFFDSIVP